MLPVIITLIIIPALVFLVPLAVLVLVLVLMLLVITVISISLLAGIPLLLLVLLALDIISKQLLPLCFIWYLQMYGLKSRPQQLLCPMTSLPQLKPL